MWQEANAPNQSVRTGLTRLHKNTRWRSDCDFAQDKPRRGSEHLGINSYHRSDFGHISSAHIANTVLYAQPQGPCPAFAGDGLSLSPQGTVLLPLADFWRPESHPQQAPERRYAVPSEALISGAARRQGDRRLTSTETTSARIYTNNIRGITHHVLFSPLREGSRGLSLCIHATHGRCTPTRPRRCRLLDCEIDDKLHARHGGGGLQVHRTPRSHSHSACAEHPISRASRGRCSCWCWHMSCCFSEAD